MSKNCVVNIIGLRIVWLRIVYSKYTRSSNLQSVFFGSLLLLGVRTAEDGDSPRNVGEALGAQSVHYVHAPQHERREHWRRHGDAHRRHGPQCITNVLLCEGRGQVLRA